MFTLDPIASSLAKSAADAEDVGLLDPVDLEGIYDLTLLNEVLTDRGDARGRGPLMVGPLTPSVPPTPLAALQVRGLSKVYGHGASAVHALDGISLDVQAGEMLCLVGASGCGKTHAAQPDRRPRHARRRARSTAAAGSPSSSRRRRCSRGSPFGPTSPSRSSSAACSAQNRARRGRPAPAHRPPRRLRGQAPARALRRHAPAGGHRPRLRPGRGHPPHGRAVRRARRDDPRPPARGARAAVGGSQPERGVRDPQRP